MFDSDYNSMEDFISFFETYEDIEEIISEHIKNILIFSDKDTPDLPLRSKMKNYLEAHGDIFDSIGMTEPKAFFLALYSRIVQVADLMQTYFTVGCIPYINNEITLNYLLLLMEVYTDNDNYKRMIEKTLFLYIFRQSIAPESFEDIDFEKYCTEAEKSNLLDKVLIKAEEENIDILQGGVEKIRGIITNEFEKLLNNLSPQCVSDV